MQATDMKDVLAVEKAANNGQLLWDKSIFLAELQSSIPHIYAVKTIGEKIVGFVGGRFQHQEAHLTQLAVSPCYQHQGYGTELLTYFEQQAKNARCQKIVLEVRQTNQEAQRLYRHFGFESVRFLETYYYMTQENAIRMEKIL